MTKNKCLGSGTWANARTSLFVFSICPFCQQWQKTTWAGNFYPHSSPHVDEADHQPEGDKT